MKSVVIVGAGPTGATLALLLVQRGIPVTLIEAAKDFRRVFRGEGLMPSGLDALAQMGLADLLNKIPSRPLAAWEFVVEGRSLFRVAEPMGANQPCTLVSQPHFLENLREMASAYPTFTWIQGVALKDLQWHQQRVVGVTLSDGRAIATDLVIGADGRNSLVRQRCQLPLTPEPKSIDVLWFKLPAHPRFVEQNVFLSIVNQGRVFSLFHGAEPGQLHLAWVLFPDDPPLRPSSDPSQSPPWSHTFAHLSPPWLAQHFQSCHEAITTPVRLSVQVGYCRTWHHPGVLLLGDAAHPMSPVRAQGINMALRDVIVAANHLVPGLQADAANDAIDQVLGQIQAEREPEILKAQRLQAEETHRGERLRRNPLIRTLIRNAAPIVSLPLRTAWVHQQRQLRQGITPVVLTV